MGYHGKEDVIGLYSCIYWTLGGRI